MDLLSRIIPIKGESEVSFSLPICCTVIVFLNYFDQMFCMLFAYIFDAKIVDDKSETDRTPIMRPESRSVFALVVSMCIQTFLKEFLGQNATLWQAVHS